MPLGETEAGEGGSRRQLGVVGVDQHWFPGEPGSPAPPLPARGPGSYSSPSQTAQPVQKALPCQQRLRPPSCLQAGQCSATAREGGLAVLGWRATPGVAQPLHRRVP